MTCARHPFRYSLCDDCRTPPESNLMLAALQAAWQEAPDPADLPIELTDRMEGGMVTHGKAAGPIRNREMLRDGGPEMVAAFHTDLSQSKGTLDMVRIARSAGVPVKVFNGRDDDGETWIDSLVSGAYV